MKINHSLSLFLVTTLLILSSCGGKNGNNSADSKTSVQIARNKAGDFGLNKGGTLSATYAHDGKGQFQWTENGTWVVKPTFNDMAMLDCSAGIFYLGCRQFMYSRGKPYLDASHIFDKDGKLVHQFPNNECLYQMAGDVGIVYRSIPNPVNANHNAEAFLFSFATLQTVKAIGKNAVFIKNGKYIQANGDVWQEKVLGGTKTHTQKRFYDRAGNLIFEAANVTQVGDNKEYGDWVTVTVNYGVAQWLNLANGKTYPWKYGENYPPEQSENAANGNAIYSPTTDEINENVRYVFEEFSESGITVRFDWGKDSELVFIVSNDNDFGCKVALVFLTEDGKWSSLETALKPKEQSKEVNPKVDKNYPVSSWSVKEILKVKQ